MENKYYSLNRILKENTDYKVIFGERSNGKTYAVLEYALEKLLENSKKTCKIVIIEKRNKNHLCKDCIGGKTTCQEKNQKR